MSSFVKLLLLPLSYLFVRSSRTAVFGSHTGFGGNAKYLFLHLLENHPQMNVYWMSDSPDEYERLKKIGLPVLRKNSAAGLWRALTAKFYVYNCYVGDIGIATFGNAFKIALWHGVGIKAIDRKSTLGSVRRLFDSKNPITKLKNLSYFVKPNRFLSTSPMMTEHFSECFALTRSRVVENLYPRCEFFFRTDEEQRRFIKKYEPRETMEVINLLSGYDYSYMYMPTWREMGNDFFSETNVDLAKLDSVLRAKNRVMLLKLHPNTVLSFDSSEFTNIKILDNNLDVYPMLSHVDCLVTDYSSILYDFILMPDKDVIIFAPDYEDYISSQRDLVYDFKDNVCGPMLFSMAELLSHIDAGIEPDRTTNGQKAVELRRRFWNDNVGHSIEDIWRSLIQE